MRASDLAAVIRGIAPVVRQYVTKAVADSSREAADLRHHAVLDVTKEFSNLRERLAALEARAPVPGPPGHDGLNGKDGADGLGFEDLAVEYDGERTVALTFTRGDVKKSWPLVLPVQIYQGQYQHGRAYVVGDTVTFANSQWCCREATITPPGDACKAWQLCVRQGRPGKNAEEAK